jgi:hypothetical protein
MASRQFRFAGRASTMAMLSSRGRLRFFVSVVDGKVNVFVPMPLE